MKLQATHEKFTVFFITQCKECSCEKGAPRDAAPSLVYMAGPTRLELATPGSTIQCSNQLSYGPSQIG